MIPDTPRRTFAAVVCVCCEKDSAVWAISSPQIVKSIVSGSYGVIVPDQEVEHFERVSAPQFKVTAESKYLYGYSSEDLRSWFPAFRASWAGWYIQKLVKISASASRGDDDVVLIWDGDTVLLKRIEFVTREGLLMYYKCVNIISHILRPQSG
jgi:hypothetical protein